MNREIKYKNEQMSSLRIKANRVWLKIVLHNICAPSEPWVFEISFLKKMIKLTSAELEEEIR
jgi:hypothetical protein